MDLVRDVLDKLVVDRRGHEMGRVDGIRLEQRDGQPLRFASLLMGPAALEARVPRLVARLAAAVARVLGVRRRSPAEIDTTNITKIGREIVVGQSIVETEAARMESRLRAIFGALGGRR